MNIPPRTHSPNCVVRSLRVLLAAGAMTLGGGLTACAQQASVETAADREAAYVASTRGQVYYWVGCDSWRSLAEGNRRWFETAAEAEREGYRPSTARGCDGPERREGPTPAATKTCTVERIVDGDTIVCEEAGERIRLILVDAPELSQGEYGLLAREALLELIPVGSVAGVELDVQERDRYGRILAYLYAEGGAMVNEELVRRGYAVVSVHPPNVRHLDRVRAAAAEARAERRGLWRGSAFECSPEEHRRGRCD